ncbi:MAG TPA: glycosyltransferase [Acidimicrobiia bacterium]
MTLLTVEPTDETERLHRACDDIARRAPELSAHTFLSRGQRRFFIGLAVITVVGLVLVPKATVITFVAMCIVAYVAVVTQRIVLTHRSLTTSAVVAVTDEEARALPADALPVYTVLVPMYKEAAVVEQLVAHLRAIEYPRHLLEVLLLVEEDDSETLAAVLAHAHDDFSVITVPAGEPRTKPRALNYGLTFATGEYVTIYDAEDRPEPLQLRRAVVAFDRAGPDVACLQAQLAFWNFDQNLLTRLFEVEYRQCFELVLPAISVTDAPVPLGGTSNHIRRSVLDNVGAWDPYNVTEDADLGIRLRRAGYRCLVFESTTLEEANSDYVNWNKQRSRWYKGYLQTWLVHMRSPMRVLDELGWRGFLEFNAFIAGTPLLSLLNLAFWATTLGWFVGHFSAIQAVFPAPLYYPALALFVFGNFAMAYLFILAARNTGRPSLVWSACVVPLYWLFMAIAAVKAFYQLAVDRSFWEKTVHGLAAPDDPDAIEASPTPEHVRGDGGIAPLDSAGLEALGVVRIAVAPIAVAPMAPVGGAESREHDRPPVEPWIDAEPRGDALVPRARLRRSVGRALAVGGALTALFAIYVAVFSGPFTRPVSGQIVSTVPVAPASGTCVAGLTVARIGLNSTICEGTATDVVAHRIGHVPGTALPGQRGEAVVVAHRDAFGAIGQSFARLRVGDRVVVHIGGASIDYDVVSRSTESRNDVSLDGDAHARLMLVTGASGVDPGKVLVVQAAATSLPHVQFAGTAPPERGTAHLPGGDGGELLLAVGCLVFAGVAAASRKRFAELAVAPWASGCLVAITIASVLAACIIAARGLPPTF